MRDYVYPFMRMTMDHDRQFGGGALEGREQRWRYASMDNAVRGLLCSAGGARAVQAAGEHAVRDVLQRALAQFQDPQTRVVTMRNTFRWVAARR